MNISLLCEDNFTDDKTSEAEEIFSPYLDWSATDILNEDATLWEHFQRQIDDAPTIDLEKIEKFKQKIKHQELDIMSTLQEKMHKGANRLAEKILSFEEALFKL